jgi:hypothetical protein
MKDMAPDFIANITLYPSDKGGRLHPIVGEWFGCPCKFDEKDFSAWDCRILTHGEQFLPGETKQFGMKFLSLKLRPCSAGFRNSIYGKAG